MSAPLRVSAQAVHPANVRLELELRSLTDGSRSTGAVRVGQSPASCASWAMVTDGAFLLAGLLVVGGVLTGRLSRPVVGAASASAAVAVVVMLLRPYLSAAQPEGAAPIAEVGRPYVQGREGQPRQKSDLRIPADHDA